MKKIITYFDPSATKIFIEKEDENGEMKRTLSSTNNFVSMAEIVARVIEIDTPDQIPQRLDTGYSYYHVLDFQTLKAGEGIYFDELANSYKADRYGFVVKIESEIRVLPLRFVSQDKYKVFYFIYPTKFGKTPVYKDIEEDLHLNHILAGIGKNKIEEQLATINPEDPKLIKLLAAKGREPVNGHEEYFVPLMDVEKKAGSMKDDGSIDFKQVNSIVQVYKGQEVLQRIPDKKPEDGYDVFGTKVTAITESDLGFKKGDNIVQASTDPNIFLAGIDGCIKVVKNKVTIFETVIINGDVNYETGNIEFKGSVMINGSVLPGFSVKADGDVIIDHAVEDAQVHAGGNVTVRMGVVGKEMVRIISGGSVAAKYLLNAHVEAAGDIVIADSIINSDVFSNHYVVVTEKQGKIIGGKTTALYRIQAKVAGAINETGTTLTVGRNLYIEKEAFELKKEIARLREEVGEVALKIRTNFGENVFKDPKGFLAILPPVKKKNCLLLLKELSDGNGRLKELNAQCQLVEEKLKLEEDPVIFVYDKIFPGTTLNIKKSVRKIDQEYTNVRFYEDPEGKMIRFNAAV